MLVCAGRGCSPQSCASWLRSFLPLAYPGVIHITCNVRHTWMNAYLVVTEHPYHAVTDLYGEYEIREVPPGIYKLKVWHEVLGVEEKEVQVEEGKEIGVNFSLPVKE